MIVCGLTGGDVMDWDCTFMRLLMVSLTSVMDGLSLGSLSQQRVIRLSIGSGRSLIKGGRVPMPRYKVRVNEVMGAMISINSA